MHRPLHRPLLLLFLVVNCRAAVVEVKSSDELCDAIGAFAHEIRVIASFCLCTACAADIRHPLVITANTGIVLDLCAASKPVLRVSGGAVSLRSISVAWFARYSPAPGQGPISHIDPLPASVVIDHVIFHYKGTPEAFQQLPHWAAAAHHPQLSDSKTIKSLSNRAHSTQAWRLHQWPAEARQAQQHIVNSTLVLDVESCYVSGSSVVLDADSFNAAVTDSTVVSITLIQDFGLTPDQCNSIRQAVGRRYIAIYSCPAANAVHQQLIDCVGCDAAAAPRQSQLQLSRKMLQDQQHAELQDHAADKEPQQLHQGTWPQNSSPGSFSSDHQSRKGARAATRRLSQVLAEPIEAATSPADKVSPTPKAAPAADVEPQKSRSPPKTAANSTWLSPNRAAIMAATYPAGDCFSDVGDYSFAASNAAELKRLLADNAVTHIELKGNLVLTPDLFPPENANDKSKGMNISHHVEIRACTGDINNPITVDINNLQQQIYVSGFLRWAGNIKFINSWPSPRRAGLFPLISILSVEQDGIIEFEDVEIEGTESCPLFEPNHTWWSSYTEDPLSTLFVPKPADYDRLSENEVLLLNWKFNKSAWGPNGISLAVGDGYWHWIDVMALYTEEQKSAQSILQIALPVVLGTLALITLLLGGLLWRRRRAAAAGLPLNSAPKDVSLACRGISMSEDHKSAGDMVVAPRQASLFDTSKTNASVDTQELIEEARRRLQTCSSGRKDTNIVFEGLLGEGTFGKVYRGQWHGTVVAVKTMLFPAAMSGKEKREKMAIMETAISSSLSHPNIVQTYTYIVKPLTGELAMQALEGVKGSQSAEDSELPTAVASEAVESFGWEVRLILELCDRGSLKDLLSSGGLHSPETGKPDMVGIVATALDVTRAMLHLHSENIIHSDLKARNVVLKSAGSDARGFVAKVSDFGLSVRMDPSETHVSNVYQGTLTHMAPEVLMYGKLSRASDVYAFGILLWELYTGQQAFQGTPKVLLGHEITKMGRRPEFPDDCPFDYQLLACRCWESDPAIRPSFQQILDDLQRMANKLAQDASLSLTQQRTAVAAAAGTVQQQQQQILSPGAPAACDLDHTRLHKWEPQTSLLDLNSAGSSQSLLVPLDMEDSRQQQQQQLGCSQLPPCSMSWGSHSACGGLWFGGSLAPSNMPSSIELPIHPLTADHAGMEGPVYPAAEGGAAAQGFTALYGAAHLAAASHAAPGQHLQQQQQHHHHWSPNIHSPSHFEQSQQPSQQHRLLPDLQWSEQQPNQLQQQQQQLLSNQERQWPSSAQPASLSKSAVCLQDSSSTLQASSAGQPHAAQQQQGPDGVSAAADGGG